jgi:putative ABC transport system substrate-binding protein
VNRSDNQKSAMQIPTWLGIASVLTLFFGVAAAPAQQTGKIFRMGILDPSTASGSAVVWEALRQELSKLGWIAKKATATIPIVMSQDSDPVGNGFIASLAKPGGNITGLSSYHAELGGKRLELLKEVLPGVSRVAVLGISTAPQNARALKDTALAAGALGMKLQYLDVLGPKDIDAAFRAANTGRAEALLALNSFLLSAHQKQIIELTVKSRLPAIYYDPEFVEAGGLMTYGASFNELDKRAAIYVDKILKGAKPADLPVEQPTKFEFIVNLKAAKQIGLTIPPNVLARADRVIR